MTVFEMLFVLLPAILAGLIQGLTGFGFGVVVMVFYPFLVSVVEAASVTQCLAVFLNLFMVVKYRRFIKLSMLIKPWIIYFPSFFLFLWLVGKIDVTSLKPVLGVFLVLLSIYLLRLSGRLALRDNWGTVLVCAALSAAIDATFGIGGPPIVLYFMSVTTGKEQYLGSIQGFLLLTGIYGTGVRIISGMFPLSLLPLLGLGFIGMLLGFLLSIKLTAGLDGEKIKKLVYYCIGLAGIITVATSFLR